MNFLAWIISWLNVPTNEICKFILFPISMLPGWLSNTIISAFTGVLLLVIFKYTSNQTAIGRVRDNIKANMLALKLFKESLHVTLKAQGGIFKGAFYLLVYAVRPMLVMIVPVVLLLGQMGLWYQFRPLRPGEEAVVTLGLNGKGGTLLQKVRMEVEPAADVVLGPIRDLSKREIYWKIRARENGFHNIVFHIDNLSVEKELMVGNGFMRISAKRPGWKWADILLHPGESPFRPNFIVRNISIEYPVRVSYISGTDWWIVYFFIVSLIFAFIFKPVFRVRI